RRLGGGVFPRPARQRMAASRVGRVLWVAVHHCGPRGETPAPDGALRRRRTRVRARSHALGERLSHRRPLALGPSRAREPPVAPRLLRSEEPNGRTTSRDAGVPVAVTAREPARDRWEDPYAALGLTGTGARRRAALPSACLTSAEPGRDDHGLVGSDEN